MSITDGAESYQNVTDYLFETCLRPENENRSAYIVGNSEYSFSQVYALTNQISNFLTTVGVEPGDRIIMSVVDGADFPSIFLGSIRMGGVSVPINTYLKAADYRYYINDSGAKVLFIDHSLVDTIDEIRNDLVSVTHIIVCGQRRNGYMFIDDCLKTHHTTVESFPRSKDDTAMLLYSSGSTGAPKGVLHTHANIYYATELFGMGAQGISRGDVIQCAPKMFFAFGLGNQVYFPLRAAATVIVNAEPATPARIWELWLRHEPTIVMSVPTLYAGMLKLAEAEVGQQRVKQAIHQCRFGVSGGEALPAALLKRWRDFADLEILDGVGTTEMTHMFILNRSGQSVPRSCGKIVDGYTALIVDDDGREVPTGDVGNLLVFGPTVMRGYWNKPEQTATVMRNVGLLTGDKFRIDNEGNYYLIGRSDDMLKVGGVWVSPIEIEAVLSHYPDVLESAVVGCPDENQMIKPKGIVVLGKGVPGDRTEVEQSIKEFCRTHLAHIKCPRWIEVLDELPKTATGKIQRFRLRQQVNH